MFLIFLCYSYLFEEITEILEILVSEEICPPNSVCFQTKKKLRLYTKKRVFK